MLKTRIATAVIALIVLGAVLFVVPADVAKLVIGLVVLAGAWEWAGFLGFATDAYRWLYVILIGALMSIVYFVVPEHTVLILQLASAGWFLAFIWTFFFPTAIPQPLRWLSGVLVLVPLFVALVTLYSLGSSWLIFALLIVWAADIGAYFSGKQFGRVKLAPSISPGKTWEGVIGGLTAVAVLTIGWAMQNNLPLQVLLPFCLAVGALSVVGDLTVSMFKRTAGVKDSGKLFPGHGGVLDRVDSIAAATPVFALGLVWLGLVA